MNNITLQYSSWYIIVCVIIGFLIAGLLYYKDKKFRAEKNWLPYFLFLLRFVVISLITFFLLSPVIRSIKSNQQDPIIVLAKDVSESVANGLTDEKKSAINEGMTMLSDRLESKYEVKTLSFGGEVMEGMVDSFPEKVTNISLLFEHIGDNYADQNLGAIIVSSDGIYNEGRNPIYSLQNITAPIYTVALGDTTEKTDLTVKGLYANNIVYLGDQFSIQADVQAFNSNGKNTTLRLYRITDSGSELLEEEKISIDRENFFSTKEYVVETVSPGINRYRVSLTGISGEISRSNNSKDIFIQVLDARQKILLFAQAPHPDISAISQIISSNKNYETTIKYVGDEYDLNDFDQVIFHNLPGKGNDISAALRIVKEKKMPHLFIVGAQMNIAAFNNAQDMIKIQGNGQTLEEVNPAFNNTFKSFTSSDELRTKLNTFPPLVAPFGEYSLISNASSYLLQNIKSVETDYPLITFQDKGGFRSAVIVGEGIWKWKLFDYLQHGNYEIVSELLSKIIQYISTKKDNRKFIAATSKNLFKENESIKITAQLYNDNYELINEPEVFLSVYSSEGQEFPFTMSRNNNSYSTDIGLLPPGSYSFNAKTNYNGQEYVDQGRFSIQEIQLESFDLQARHHVLAALSENGGGLYYATDLEAMAEDILNRESIQPVIYQNTRTTPLINQKWWFFLILGLLTLEWMMRRYFGSY